MGSFTRRLFRATVFSRWYGYPRGGLPQISEILNKMKISTVFPTVHTDCCVECIGSCIGSFYSDNNREKLSVIWFLRGTQENY